MKQDRRTFIASAGTIAATAIAGCSQISSDRPLEFESTPARVPEDTLGETGYEETDTEAIEVERTFDIGGEERTVTVTNQRVAYEKEIRAEIELPEALPGVVFTTLTTPSVEILGQEANPVADMSNEELLDRGRDRYGGLENVEIDGEDTVTVLGETTTRTRFAAEAQFGETAVDVYIHLSNPVESDGDFIVGAGAHPQLLADEESTVVSMIEAIRHEG